MTFKEKLKMEHPDLVNDEMFTGGCFGCPADRGYEHRRQGLCHTVTNAGRGEMLCTACWNRTIPGTGKYSPILSREDLDALCRIGKENHPLDGLSAKVYLIDELHGASKARIFRGVTIQKVIFNDPATIVIWSDGEKTVVKCQNGEPFDPEKGLAMAITKRALGGKGKYFDEIKKWTKDYEPKKKRQKVLKASEVDVVAIQDEMRRQARKRSRGLN